MFIPPQKAWRGWNLASEPLNSQRYEGNLLCSIKMTLPSSNIVKLLTTLKRAKEQLIYPWTRYYNHVRNCKVRQGLAFEGESATECKSSAPRLGRQDQPRGPGSHRAHGVVLLPPADEQTAWQRLQATAKGKSSAKTGRSCIHGTRTYRHVNDPSIFSAEQKHRR